MNYANRRFQFNKCNQLFIRRTTKSLLWLLIVLSCLSSLLLFNGHLDAGVNAIELPAHIAAASLTTCWAGETPLTFFCTLLARISHG